MWIELDRGNTLLDTKTGASFHRNTTPFRTVRVGVALVPDVPNIPEGYVVYHSPTNQRADGNSGLVMQADWEALCKALGL